MTKNRRILSIILIFIITIITIKQPIKATLYEGNVIEKLKDGDVFYPGTTTIKSIEGINLSKYDYVLLNHSNAVDEFDYTSTTDMTAFDIKYMSQIFPVKNNEVTIEISELCGSHIAYLANLNFEYTTNGKKVLALAVLDIYENFNYIDTIKIGDTFKLSKGYVFKNMETSDGIEEFYQSSDYSKGYIYANIYMDGEFERSAYIGSLAKKDDTYNKFGYFYMPSAFDKEHTSYVFRYAGVENNEDGSLSLRIEGTKEQYTVYYADFYSKKVIGYNKCDYDTKPKTRYNINGYSAWGIYEDGCINRNVAASREDITIYGLPDELDITCKDGNTGKMICVTQASFVETTNDDKIPIIYKLKDEIIEEFNKGFFLENDSETIVEDGMLYDPKADSPIYVITQESKKEATCTENGWIKYMAKLINERKYFMDIIEKTNHKYGEWQILNNYTAETFTNAENEISISDMTENSELYIRYCKDCDSYELKIEGKNEETTSEEKTSEETTEEETTIKETTEGTTEETTEEETTIEDETTIENETKVEDETTVENETTSEDETTVEDETTTEDETITENETTVESETTKETVKESVEKTSKEKDTTETSINKKENEGNIEDIFENNEVTEDKYFKETDKDNPKTGDNRTMFCVILGGLAIIIFSLVAKIKKK